MTADANWNRAREQITIGTVVRGRVTAVRHFGVFVKLDAGPEALLLVPSFSGPGRKQYPGDYPKLGDSITARVAIINDDKRQIGLTQRNPDPLTEQESDANSNLGS